MPSHTFNLRLTFRTAAIVAVAMFVMVFLAVHADGETLAERVHSVCRDAPGAVTSEFCSMGTDSIRLVGPEGARVDIDVLVADDARLRAAGYQFIDGDVVEVSAILFVFERATGGAFHMCNVEVSLDIVWFRANGTILDALTMAPGGVRDPARCTHVYQPRRFGTYLFALELPEGSLARLGIESIDEWRLDVD